MSTMENGPPLVSIPLAEDQLLVECYRRSVARDVAAEEPGCLCRWENGQWDVCEPHRTLHSVHTTPVISCDLCQDALTEAREVAADEAQP